MLYRAAGFTPYSTAPAGYHYGINSPMEAVFLLLPMGVRAHAIQYFLLVRAAAAGTALCWFLRRHFASESRLLPFLCVAYGAGVYTACIINVAWLDAAILLPFMLDTTDGLAEGRGRLRFGIFVFVCVLSNCYTAWPLCLTCFVYLIWRCVAYPGPMDWRRLRHGVSGYLRGLIPGAAAALVCLLPVLWGYLHGGAFHISPEAREVGFAFQDVLYCLFYGRYSFSSASAGLPYIYSGMAGFALALLYFFNKDGTRQKFASSFFLVALAASYLIEMPGISWQNGEDLAVFPFRYGFVFSAILLLFAADTLIHGTPPIGSVLASLVFFGIWVLGYRQYVGAGASYGKLAMGIALYLASCVCLWLRDRCPRLRQGAAALLAVLILFDVYASSCITLYGVLR